MPRLKETQLPLVPGAASYRPVYREGSANHCPGCGRSQWIVGRFSCECAFCATALPLQEGGMREAYSHEGEPIFFTRAGAPRSN